jgi:hypothetical protein
MIKIYSSRILLPVLCLFVLFFASCKKQSDNLGGDPPMPTPKKIGFYEIDSAGYKELLMNISKIGTKSTDYDLVFDTGSGGMVIDANGVVPASMITNTGFSFSGDSTIVDGIIITNQTSAIAYGDDSSSRNVVYGNLAYADVTVGDDNGNVVVKRLPFFLYYKAVDTQDNLLPAHQFDVLGVSSESDITFPNNVSITSPLSYYDPGSGLTKGFKIAVLGTSNFSKEGTYAPAVTLGLTAADLGTSGFIMNPLAYIGGEGFIPVFPGTITVATVNVLTEMLFDTGTSPYTYIEDDYGPSTLSSIKPNVRISIATSSGFGYSYTTAKTDNLTLIENPQYSGSGVSIIGLDFFTSNEYLLDFTNHQVGLKNN